MSGLAIAILCTIGFHLMRNRCSSERIDSIRIIPSAAQVVIGFLPLQDRCVVSDKKSYIHMRAAVREIGTNLPCLFVRDLQYETTIF